MAVNRCTQLMVTDISNTFKRKGRVFIIFISIICEMVMDTSISKKYWCGVKLDFEFRSWISLVLSVHGSLILGSL